MRRHPVTLKKADISPGRYLELQGICAQYNDYVNGYLGKMGQNRARIIKAAARAAGGENWEKIIDAALIEEKQEKSFYMQRMLFYVRLHRELGFDK